MIVMPGLVPGIHVLKLKKSWMLGSSPSMTYFVVMTINEKGPHRCGPFHMRYRETRISAAWP